MAQYFAPSKLEHELKLLTDPWPISSDGKSHTFDPGTPEKPRKVYIVPTLPQKRVEIEHFLTPRGLAPGGFMREETLWDYEVDPVTGDPVPGDDMGPGGKLGYKVRQYPDRRDPSRQLKATRPLVLYRDRIELTLPADKVYLEQLLRVPQNSNVSVVDGFQTNCRIRDFYIEDPRYTRELRRREVQAESQARELFSSIPEGQYMGYAIFLDIIHEVRTTEDDNGAVEIDIHDLRRKLESLALDSPAEFLDAVTGDPMFNDRMLLRMARYNGVITASGTDGYQFMPSKSRKKVLLAQTETELLDRLRNNEFEAWIKEIQERSGFLEFISAGSRQKRQPKQAVAHEVDASEALKAEIEALRAQLAAVKAQGPAVAESSASKRGRGRPKGSKNKSAEGGEQ
jgi:hypothetical protein